MDIKTDNTFKGKETEFEQLVNSNKLVVYSTVLANLKYAAEVDDIVQETFIHAYYNFETLRDKEKAKSWLCGIARNKSMNFNRSRKNTVVTDFEGTPPKLLETDSAEDTYIEQYDREYLIKSINTLSPKLRETVIMFYIAGNSVREISNILAIPEGTVKFRLSDARKKLKKELMNVMLNEKTEIDKKDLYAEIQTKIDKSYELKRNEKSKEASELCDEAFKMIAEYPSLAPSDAEETQKLLYNLYHAKANAVQYIESNLEYLEKALAIVEKSGDLKWLAQEYSYYSIALSNSGKDKRQLCLEYSDKSVETAKKSGDNILYANCLFWNALKYYKDSKNAEESGLPKFKEILNFKDELLNGDSSMKDIDIYVLALGAYKSLSKIEELGGWGHIEEFETLCPRITYEDETVKLYGEPGHGQSANPISAIYDVFVTPPAEIGYILHNDLHKGYICEKPKLSYTYNPVKIKLEVMGMDEEISVVGGDFKDCIHIKYTGEVSDADMNDTESHGAKTNRRCNGVTEIWYAPNVGIVKITEAPIEGSKFSIELSEYKINNTDETELIKKYLPVALGNIWKYETFDGDNKPVFEDGIYESVFEVEHTSHDYYFISHWGYNISK